MGIKAIQASLLFLRSKICSDMDILDADYAVLGVPYDEGSPSRGLIIHVKLFFDYYLIKTFWEYKQVVFG